MFTTSVSGRWKDISEADISVVYYRSEVLVAGDGSYQNTLHREIVIHKPAGIEKWGTYTAVFPDSSYVIEDIKASTIVGNAEYLVDKEKVEIENIGGTQSGFDARRRITIAFPHVEVGSRLKLKMIVRRQKSPLSNHFDYEVSFGRSMLVKKGASLILGSEKPLYFKRYGNIGALDIKQYKKGKLYHYEVTLKEDVLKIPHLENDRNAFIINPSHPIIRFSTSRTYSKMVEPLIKEYEKILNTPLPEHYRSIASEAETKESLVEVIDFIIDEILNSHRYMGDWRTRKGGYIPRTLNDIVETRYGDCKDFSAVLVAILRNIGYTAHVAWIYRGNVNYPLRLEVPASREFNHAIVYVKKNGRHLWIDPTNRTSNGDRIREDIMDRYALILDPESLRLEKTPLPSPDIDLKNETVEYYFSGDGFITRDIYSECVGNCAEKLTSYLYGKTDTEVKDILLKLLVGRRKIEKVNNFKTNYTGSRIVQDIMITLSVTYKEALADTTAGHNFIMRPLAKTYRDLDVSNYVSDLYLGSPRTLSRTQVVRNSSLIGKLPKPCSVGSPWMTVKHTIQYDDKDIFINSYKNIKKNYIYNSELRNETFAKLQKDLRKCDLDYGVVFSKEVGGSYFTKNIIYMAIAAIIGVLFLFIAFRYYLVKSKSINNDASLEIEVEKHVEVVLTESAYDTFLDEKPVLVYLCHLFDPDTNNELMIGRYPLYHEINLIGRYKHSVISIDDTTVSKKHAIIRIAEEKMYVMDLSSANGTFVNDEKIESFKEKEVFYGDTIQIGRSYFSLEENLAERVG